MKKKAKLLIIVIIILFPSIYLADTLYMQFNITSSVHYSVDASNEAALIQAVEGDEENFTRNWTYISNHYEYYDYFTGADLDSELQHVQELRGSFFHLFTKPYRFTYNFTARPLTSNVTIGFKLDGGELQWIIHTSAGNHWWIDKGFENAIYGYLNSSTFPEPTGMEQNVTITSGFLVLVRVTWDQMLSGMDTWQWLILNDELHILSIYMNGIKVAV